MPTQFRPFYGKYAGKDCDGFLFTFYPDREFRPYTAGIEIIIALRKTHPELFLDTLVADRSQKMFAKVTGSTNLFEALLTKRQETISVG